MHDSSFTRNALLIFSGPIVWAVHFIAIYGWTGVLCARQAKHGEWLGMALVEWGVLLTSAAAAVVIVVTGFCLCPRTGKPDNQRFMRWMARALAVLALLAIAWETLPVFLTPAC